MSVKINSCSITGFDCHLIEIEAEILNGMSSFEIVGLADTAVQEAKQRVYAAIKNSSAEFPRRRKIINLAPADLKKHGPHYDLAIAVSLLIASKQIAPDFFQNTIVLGELALSGKVRKIRGVLVMTAFAKKAGFENIIVPFDNAKEAMIVSGIKVFGIKHLSEIISGVFAQYTRADENLSPKNNDLIFGGNGINYETKIEDIKGHEYIKRMLLIAAAGNHNFMLHGPPGAGKTMIVKALPSILPPLAFEEAIEVTKIHSIAGLLPTDDPLVKYRPFRNVHHTASAVSIVGGGAVPHPGEISLSHRGVLFFDELPEFPRAVLETLRQPLEDGTITVSRAAYRTVFPARFLFASAMNPCPCGFAGDKQKPCTCTPSDLRRYFKKVSGPLLDRIDLFITVPRLAFEKLTASRNLKSNDSQTSEIFQQKVIKARQMQIDRFSSFGIFTNSEMRSKDTDKFCPIPNEGRDLLRHATQALCLSPRSYYKILKISRTIADLEGCKDIETGHIAEALQYRPKL